MTLEKKYFIYLLFLMVGSLIVASPSNLLADEADSESASEEVVDEKENGKDAKMKKCMKEAKTSKEKKDCAKQNQKTVEEFIEDEGLELIEGFLEIYADEEKENYFLRINNDDLNNQFLYFAYIMNAPQGGAITGGLPSDGKVLEFRKFKQNNIGLYQINTAYMKGDDNNIGNSTITNITEAFIETFKEVAKSDNSALININKFLMSERIEAISYVPQEYREYISVNYGRPDPKKTFIKEVFNNETNTAVEVTLAYENKSPNSDAYSVSAVTEPR